MASDKTAVGHPDPDDERCSNCGACKHCGHGGVKFVPYPVTAPYPVYPQTTPYIGGPYRPYTGTPPWQTTPYTRPITTWGGQISGTSSTVSLDQTFNA